MTANIALYLLQHETELRPRPQLKQESLKNVPDFGRLLGLRQSASATRRVAQSLHANTQCGGIHRDENTVFGGGTCVTAQSDLPLQISSSCTPYNTIPIHDTHTHLGMTSQGLRFHQLINTTCKKVQRKLSPLFPIAQHIPRPFLDQIYTRHTSDLISITAIQCTMDT